MIRDRLKNAVRKAGLKFFGMEFDAEERQNRNQKTKPPADIDLSKIPSLYAHTKGEEDGGTPGAKHPEEIGRTWTSAQLLAGGYGIKPIDVRGPDEFAQGHLPFAVNIPASVLLEHLAELPQGEEKETTYVAIYDAVGGDVATQAGEKLREAGWPRARHLRGGFAEWVQEGEEVIQDDAVTGAAFQIGDTVKTGPDQTGLVWRVHKNGDAFTYDVLLPDGSAAHGRSAEELAG